MIPYLLTALRLLLALVFIVAGAAKVRRPRLFSRQVAAYHLLPATLVQPVAYTLPWLELLLGFALLIGLEVQVSSGLGAILMLVFSLAIGINLARGRQEMDCGCFGSGHSEKISLKLLGRDLLFLLSLLVLIRHGGGLLAWDDLGETTKYFLWFDVGLQRFTPLLLAVGGAYLVFCLVRQLSRLIKLWVEEQPE
jgi:uncharacterized membrane protein YphA (DoxX/SURF4 family)